MFQPSLFVMCVASSFFIVMSCVCLLACCVYVAFMVGFDFAFCIASASVCALEVDVVGI